MSYDVLGPANAPGAVTVRPSDSRAVGAADTWFADCTNNTANDGTALQAAFLNGVLAELRHLLRGNGTTGGGSPIVTEGNSDDDMLLKSAQYLIQRGLMKFGVDTGAADALVVSLSPALQEYKAGQAFLVQKSAAANATTTPTINFNGLGARPLKSIDGSAISINSLPATSWLHLLDDGTNFLVLNLPSNAQTALYFHSIGAGTATFVSSVVSLASDMTLVENFFSDATFSGGVLTIGPKSAGVWEFSANLGIATPLPSWTQKVEIYKNYGAAGQLLIAHCEYSEYGTNMTGNSPAMGIAKLKAGDTVGAYCIQNVGSSQTNSTLSRFVGKRVGA